MRRGDLEKIRYKEGEKMRGGDGERTIGQFERTGVGAADRVSQSLNLKI